jgi:hypothetical protein
MIKIPKTNKVAKVNQSKYPYIDGVLLAIVVTPQFKVSAEPLDSVDAIFPCDSSPIVLSDQLSALLEVDDPLLDHASEPVVCERLDLPVCAVLHNQCPSEAFYGELKRHFQSTLGVEFEAGLAGHEHGKLNGRCHFQCAVKLSKRIQRTIKPFMFKMGSFDMTGTVQAGKSWDALLSYCSKEGDFYVENCSAKAIDVYRAIAESHNATPQEIMLMLSRSDPKALLMNGDKIFKNFTQFIHKPLHAQFEWSFPQHLLELINQGVSADASEVDTNFFIRIERVYQWYLEFCVSDQWANMRKKSLCLYSKERGLGKTVFATSLVGNQPERFIYCRNALDGRMFANKENVAKLILIDDVQYNDNQVELWKALVSSSPVIFNTKYCQQSWNQYLPVIITTNSKVMLELFVNDDRFNTQVLSIEIEKYMGVPKTKPAFMKKEVFISTTTEDDIAFIRQKRERSGQNFNS